MSLTVRGPGMSPAGLRTSEQAFERGLARLSSGLRITRAADDAAGLAISQRMRAQVTGSAMAARNVQDGISMLQTAEGGLSAITSMLQRARELAVQAASTGTMTSDDRQAAAAEVRQLVAELDRVARTTSYNGLRMLDGSRPAGFSLQVGADAADSLVVAAYDMGADALQLSGALVTTSSVVTMDTYTTSSANRTTFDTSAGRNAFSFSVDGGAVRSFTVPEGVYATAEQRTTLLSHLQAGLAAAGVPVTVAMETSGKDAKSKSKYVFTATDGATSRITVTGSGADALGITTTVSGTTSTTVSLTSTGASLVDLVAAGSGDAISLCDDALATVLGARSQLGATQNRLEHRLSVLATTGENLDAARSRLEDADVAKEWAGIVRAQVLREAGLAVQAQAAPSGQRVLQLLTSLR